MFFYRLKIYIKHFKETLSIIKRLLYFSMYSNKWYKTQCLWWHSEMEDTRVIEINNKKGLESNFTSRIVWKWKAWRFDLLQWTVKARVRASIADILKPWPTDHILYLFLFCFFTSKQGMRSVHRNFRFFFFLKLYGLALQGSEGQWVNWPYLKSLNMDDKVIALETDDPDLNSWQPL